MVLLSGIGVGEHQPFGGDQPDVKFPGSPLPIAGRSAISAAFIARLIKGCRGDDPCGHFPFGKNLSTVNALTSILAVLAALAGGFVAAFRRAKCPS